MPPLEVSTADLESVYRLYSACTDDLRPWVLDLRPQKDYKKGHLLRSYSVRLTADQRAVVDFSKNQYDQKWTDGCWWAKQIVAYGDSGLKKDHPVLQFLLRDGRAESIAIVREGFDSIAKEFPFFVTASVKANAQKREFPGQIAPGLLYLGNWDHANDPEQLKALNIKGIITIHNHPENLKPKSSIKHIQIEAADVESYDISQHFSSTFDFIEDARRGKYAVLVHCGAGVSRSATLCIAYLMRKNLWPLKKSFQHCVKCRSSVLPNDGFMRCLEALEGALRLGSASGARAAKGFAEDIAGEKVVVREEEVEGGKADSDARDGGRDLRDGRDDRGRGRDTRDDRDSRDDRERGRDSRDDRERGRDDRERGRDRRDDRDRDAGRDRRDDRERGRDRRDDRDRDGGRDRRDDRERGRRDVDRKRGRDDGDRRRSSPLARDAYEAEKDAGGGEGEGAAEEPPAVVLEVAKEGEVISKLKIPALKSGQRVIFGRLPQCDIVLEHLSVSRQHAHIFRDDTGNVFIEDLATSHGTNVNEAWLRPKVPKAITAGSVIRFGASTRSYRVLEVAAGAPGSNKRPRTD